MKSVVITMARIQKKAEPELRIHAVNGDMPLDPGRLKQFARWLLEWGLEQGTITPPTERGIDYGKKEKPEVLQNLRQEICAY